MPLPLAAGLYGILLGLGFTTFVLSFGVWALAGISVALGDPTAGVIIGPGFVGRSGAPTPRGVSGGGLGAERARPSRGGAPAVDTRFGNRCIELMAERPSIYRLFR